MQKITPFLWFNDQAEEAARFYTSIFKDGKITDIAHYGEGAPAPAGSVMSVTFELNGQAFSALNGGPVFSFTPAISFFVNCETQEEVDMFWQKLSEGGEAGQCGWLTDRFGVSWQIVPAGLMELLQGKDAGKARAAMEAMLKMNKLDIHQMREAYDRG